ncbi:carboxypeptidase-like regulatory domain-containing protein [Sphingobacterium sp. SRCM116780]|uniref:carboxypeptidase-like regulatory domain-containing protein n=1 Tax=Sphingobacterium sp. SRCM116780 TaxID=2907623 RepID=UPI001F2F40E5|nr:carboxypeptidase-like regulatory domain-containing protein [Sphingobacterium sp. SRCM116780]UIR55139.1 carboxypeptidase-like regulatory domain-containing protein [Sphingobacterium sp. SRCM116780]
MKLYLLAIFSLCINFAFSQNTGSLKGTVLDSYHKPLEKATVSILVKQDSSLLLYALTNEKGEFSLVKLPTNKDLILYISHINSDNFHQIIRLAPDEKRQIDSILMEGKQLDEVVIAIAPPVRMNKDTLEYNTDYFKTRPNANAEELLKQLPGLQINMDGTIYYEGKEVSQVKVNGKDFFASDLRIATRNLDASLIKTVQVYRDKGESKKIVEDEEKLPITINLKFKKDFLKASFGKLYGSVGTRDRYEAGGLVNSFRDTLQLSFIGFGNNINRESFDYNELSQHAGLGRAENYGFNDFGGRNYGGKANDMAAGFNLNNDWGQKTKLNVMYMLKYKKDENSNTGNQSALYDSIEQFNENIYNTHNKSVAHNIKTLFRHRMDTTAYLEFTPNLNISNGDGKSNSWMKTYTIDKPLNNNTSTNLSNKFSLDYSHSFYIEKQWNKNHIISLRNNISINKNKSEETNNQISNIYQNPIPNSSLWENKVENEKSSTINLNVGYNNRSIEKLNFDFYVAYNSSKNTPFETIYFNRDSTGAVHGEQYENNYSYDSQEYISGIKFFWKPIKNLAINFGTAYALKDNQFDLYKIDEHKTTSNGYWLPNINIRFQEFELSWSKDLASPTTSRMQTVTDDLNPLMTRLSSFFYQNVQNQRARFSFNKYAQNYQIGFYADLNYKDKSEGSKSWRDVTTGRYTIQSFQAGSTTNHSIYFYGRYNFKSGKDWTFYISQNSSLYTYERYASINDVDNKLSNLGINLKQEFSVTWKNLIGFSPKYEYSWNKAMNSVQNNPNFIESSYETHKIGAGLNINPIKGFSLETSYSLENRASGLSERQNYHILNSSLYYTLKNNSQIKLTGFDILNQNTQNYWGTYGNTTYYHDSITLRQYFLLGYIYKFKITTLKK